MRVTSLGSLNIAMAMDTFALKAPVSKSYGDALGKGWSLPSQRPFRVVTCTNGPHRPDAHESVNRVSRKPIPWMARLIVSVMLKPTPAAHVIDQSVELVPVDHVKAHPRNPRRGDLDAISDSIATNGFYGAVVAQRSTGFILAGNHRYLAAKEAGLGDIPVMWVDVDDDLAVRILLADNRTNDLAHYDDAALVELLQSLPELTGTGYDPAALDQLLRDLATPLRTPRRHRQATRCRSGEWAT